MDYTQSKVSIDDTYAALRSSLEANPNISIVAEVDYQANAASVDLTLSPTMIIFFGNSNLATPLIQQNQLAGLDLPQKILVYQNEEGIITKNVNGSCDDAYSRLRAAIANNPALKIIAELDHQANAAKVNLELNPTRIISFGNPTLRTPLMQNAHTTALDLPQKMLVWTDSEGVAHISYNNPAFLVKRNGITENEEVLKTVTGALEKWSGVAVGNQ